MTVRGAAPTMAAPSEIDAQRTIRQPFLGPYDLVAHFRTIEPVNHIIDHIADNASPRGRDLLQTNSI